MSLSKPSIRLPLDAFIRRVEVAIADGGYILVTGDPGTGKSVALRLLRKRLAALNDVVVGIIEHPQSRTMDFYRELGELFSINLQAHNRWGGFKALRTRWTEHLASTHTRPVLVIDEAQEAHNTVLTELRVLASKELDSRQLLCVVLAGDARLVDRLRSPELQPLGSRILPPPHPGVRLPRGAPRPSRPPPRSRRNPSLLTTELKSTLADHAAGNYRILANLGDELLAAAVERELPRLDEKLFLEIFSQPAKVAKPAKRR